MARQLADLSMELERLMVVSGRLDPQRSFDFVAEAAPASSAKPAVFPDARAAARFAFAGYPDRFSRLTDELGPLLDGRRICVGEAIAGAYELEGREDRGLRAARQTTAREGAAAGLEPQPKLFGGRELNSRRPPRPEPGNQVVGEAGPLGLGAYGALQMHAADARGDAKLGARTGPPTAQPTVGGPRRKSRSRAQRQRQCSAIEVQQQQGQGHLDIPEGGATPRGGRETIALSLGCAGGQKQRAGYLGGEPGKRAQLYAEVGRGHLVQQGFFVDLIPGVHDTHERLPGQVSHQGGGDGSGGKCPGARNREGFGDLATAGSEDGAVPIDSAILCESGLATTCKERKHERA